MDPDKNPISVGLEIFESDNPDFGVNIFIHINAGRRGGADLYWCVSDRTATKCGPPGIGECSLRTGLPVRSTDTPGTSQLCIFFFFFARCLTFRSIGHRGHNDDSSVLNLIAHTEWFFLYPTIRRRSAIGSHIGDRKKYYLSTCKAIMFLSDYIIRRVDISIAWHSRTGQLYYKNNSKKL